MSKAPADSATPEQRAVAHLIIEARRAHGSLARDGLPLSRDRLADALRTEGHSVSNAHASLLVKALKEEGSSATAPANTT